MSIWFREYDLSVKDEHTRNTLAQHLDIRLIEIGPDYLRLTMPVDHRTHQAMGILHGGASVALAETAGSFGANMCVDTSRYACLGQEINANHLRPVASGLVTATARPIHRGSRSQVWQIDIRDERERLTCVSRLTLAVVEKLKSQD